MKIMVDIGHPAHVHFFKNFIQEMRKKGHKLIITARDKDVALRLLEAYGIEYTVVGKMGKGKLNLIKEWVGRDLKIYSIAKRFHPSILTGIHNPCMAHVARLTGAKSIIFTDTEHARLANRVTFPFADVICTPSCFKKDLGTKQIRYNGYHELAYLHPNYFKPDPLVLDDLGLKPSDKFVIVRFVAWQASHDIGQHGFDMETKRKLIKELEKYAKVFITSESPLPAEFEQHRISLPPEKLHDLLYHASLCISEGGTTATEAAILGTPSIHVSTTAQYCGNFEDLHKNYDLIYTYSNQEQALKKALELLGKEGLKKEWQHRRERMLVDKTDVTQFMVDFIENYPESLKK